MSTAIDNFQKILGTFTLNEVGSLIDSLKSTYDTEIKTNTSTKHILKLDPLLLMDEKENPIPTSPRVKTGTKAKLYFGVDPFPTEVTLVGGGAYGEIWQSTSDKQFLFKRVVPNKKLSFENQARSFLCESWIQTILNSDATYGKYTSKILNLYRNESIIGTELGGDIQISGEPIFFIQMEYIPYSFTPYIYSGLFKLQQMKGILYTLASYLKHFYKKYSFFHRDFHISNMMISDEGIKIIDFGAACLKYNGVYYHMPSKDIVPKELTEKFSTLFTSVKDCVSLDLAIFIVSMLEAFDKFVALLMDKEHKALANTTDPDHMARYSYFLDIELEVLENIDYLKSHLLKRGSLKYEDIYSVLKGYTASKSYTKPIFWLLYPSTLKDLPKHILEDLLETDAFYPQKLKNILKEEYTPRRSLKERILRSPLPANAPSPEKNIRNTIKSIKRLGGSRSKRKEKVKKQKTRKH